jgi:hypothetical protein
MSLRWADLVRHEPGLLDLEVRALAARRFRRTRWSNWSREICPFLRCLAGWSAQRGSLASGEAYDFAYQHLLHCWETGNRPRDHRPDVDSDRPTRTKTSPLGAPIQPDLKQPVPDCRFADLQSQS